jgi:hypothetical protein
MSQIVQVVRIDFTVAQLQQVFGGWTDLAHGRRWFHYERHHAQLLSQSA